MEGKDKVVIGILGECLFSFQASNREVERSSSDAGSVRGAPSHASKCLSVQADRDHAHPKRRRPQQVRRPHHSRRRYAIRVDDMRLPRNSQSN